MVQRLFVACLIICGCAAVSDEYRKEFVRSARNMAKLLTEEALAYELNQNETSTFKMLKASLTHSGQIAKSEVENLEVADQKFLCTICQSAASVVLKRVQKGGAKFGLRTILVGMCDSLNIMDKFVCGSLFDLNWDIWEHIITDKSHTLTAEGICSVLLQATECVTSDSQYEWSVTVDSNSPKIQGPKRALPNTTNDDLVIVQISDFHYDPEYKVGSSVKCNKPMCCSSDSGIPSDSTEAAGRWSDYRDCDISLELVQATLAQIKKEHPKIDYIYYTGDVVDHSIWRTTRGKNSDSMRTVFNEIQNTFGNVPVYPIIGNHESHPLNQFAPPNVPNKISTKWLYDFLAQEWSKWVSDSSAQETIKRGGYYTVVPKKGFRIIALNNNDCYTFNFWIFKNPQYLSQQLQWLHDTLLAAEKAGEHVHILAHVPSGAGSCYNTWSREFRRIVERFHPIIGGIFNGHTHRDEFSVVFSTGKPQHAINVAWNGGSVTPFSDVNPNYRVYRVEQKSYQVTEHDTWIFNLTDANKTPDQVPTWYKEYSFRSAYGLNDLSPATLNKLLATFSVKHDLLKKYWEYKVKLGDRSLKLGCNKDCLIKHLCEAATSQYSDQGRCNQLKVDYQRTLEGLPPIYDAAPSLKYSIAIVLFSLLSAIFYI